MPEAQTVPARKDPKKVDIYSRSRAMELSGQDPAFEYRQYSPDPKNPGYIGKKLVPHEIGDQTIGFCMVDAWEVVRPNEVKQGAKGAADSTGNLTGAVTNGDLVWAKTPKENFAKYDAIEKRRQERTAKSLRGERAGNKLVSSKIAIHQ